ncbi:hypothetical protein BUALT_Bualt16G0042400 [Buddleja alternifolia]|uniref:Uncharacterized protein n=1 Tax=Buddleja alternifolia TaxID=168488 RepID=A0AAV6WF64_9LAMI|nr:hypothetical protein BUALT_Bualt16G0042400 [Buddleja alternifolia]
MYNSGLMEYLITVIPWIIGISQQSKCEKICSLQEWKKEDLTRRFSLGLTDLKRKTTSISRANCYNPNALLDCYINGHGVVKFTCNKRFSMRRVFSSFSIMDNTQVTLEEFKHLHRIDRQLYIVLVKDLCRNPPECLQIMGLWLWLQRGGFSNIISKILALSLFLINELAEEAVACLKCLSNQFDFSSEVADISLTGTLLKRDISLQYFLENRLTIFHGVQRLICDVYIPLLSDIMEEACDGGFNENQMTVPGAARSLVPLANPTRNPVMVQGPTRILRRIQGPSQIPMAISSRSASRAPPSRDDSLVHSFSSLSIRGDACPLSRARERCIEESRANRTIFATFSKGYPVNEAEVREFFKRIFGNCIESFHMQEVEDDEQALYAKVVFFRSSFIQMILNGETKAKFTINGKHVWMRQFVLRSRRETLPCGCPSVGTSTCPHNQ